MIRRALSIVLSLSLFLLCTGCWDAVAIEKRASVLTLSFDLVDGQYEIGAIIPIPFKLGKGGVGADSAEGGGEGGSEQPQYYASVRASTMNEAIDLLTTKVQRPVYFGQTVVLVFSRAMAERGLDPILDYIRRNEEIRLSALMIVVEGKAGDFIQTPSSFFSLGMEELRSDLQNGESMGYAFRGKLGRFMAAKNTISMGSPILNMVVIDQGEFRWEGAAIFDKDKMVYKLTDRNITSVINQVRNEYTGLSVRIPCKEGFIAYYPTGVKKEVEIDTDQSTPKIILKMKVDGYIEEKTCPVKLDAKSMKKISDQLANEYEKRANAAYDLEKQLGINLFEFEHDMRMNHYSLWKQYRDKKEFHKLPVEIHYDVNVQHYGVSNE